MRAVLRRARRPLTVSLALGLAVVAAGCTTFSDTDAIARVNDVEFTQDEFETELRSAGVTSDQVVNAEAVRGLITSWIQEQLAGLPVDEAALAARYDGGAAASGSMCIAALVVEDEARATDLDAQLADGASFDELFDAHNIDPQLAQAGSNLGCLTAADLEAATGIPFVDVAATLSAGEPIGTSALFDANDNEIAWVVLRFRPFAELSADEVAIISTGAVDADVHVDARYGTFDPVTGQVVALG